MGGREVPERGVTDLDKPSAYMVGGLFLFPENFAAANLPANSPAKHPAKCSANSEYENEIEYEDEIENENDKEKGTLRFFGHRLRV